MSTETLMTAAEFERIADQLGPCELVRGEVVKLSPGAGPHSSVSGKIVAILGAWALQSKAGRVWTNETGLLVEQQPDTVRAVDALYYSYQRLARGTYPRGFQTTPPELAIEVVGRGRGWTDLLRKTSEYLAMGVDRVWIVDPASRAVHVFRPDSEPVIMAGQDVLTDEMILPGFSCSIVEFFTD
ncbi:MAG TPA: Uma2 family endonuclease [Phycisphaerae bacterium]|nr:Uma2 family endonuclease [Phycisphaerae bacterium]HON65025.1 Uma2 family endonuclease [Phycisphaerae bacterium]HPP27520.1 Uma2 family endonuclease [Phycisphaerae bacterium]